MKGIKETIEEPFTNIGTTNPNEKPLGGKALARLILFAQERDLPEDLLGIQDLESDEDKPKNKSKNKSTTEKSTESADSSKMEDYAQALVDASMALSVSPSPMMMSADGNVPEMAMMNPEVAAPDMSPPTAFGPQWRFLGPTSMTNGQTYGDSRVVVSGRISTIAVDSNNSNHVLVGAASGGVWETFNRGANWVPRTDYMPTLTTGAIAFNPTNPSIVYCGTGEGNFYAGLGAGLMRSTNGGSSWAMHCAAPFVGQGFYDLVVDRANGNHLLAGTSWGVYESSDGGASWTNRRASRCWDIATAPAGGAAAEVFAACSDGLQRSTNGGTTYTRVNLPGGPANFNRLAVAISRSSPNVAYAFGVAAGGNVALLWQKTTAGGAFVAVAPPAGLNINQAWYDWFLDISPDNPNQIYLGAIEAYRGTAAGGTWTWVMISNKAGDDIHPDQHAIAIDPNNANNIFVGNDGGLFFSANRGINWVSLNAGLGITEIEYMAQDFGRSRWLIAGTQDNGTIRYTGNAQWEHVQDGDGGDCGVNRTLPDTCYHTFYGMGMERSTNKATNWGWIGPNVPNGYGALFYPPMEVNNDVVAQAGQSVFISRNRGTNWNEIALPAGNVGSAMYIPTANAVYVGTTSGNIYRINWNGAAWGAATALTSPRAGAFISDLFVDPNNVNRIWATSTSTGGNRCFRSDNGGTAWVNCSVGLPNLPISSIEVHPGNANRIWVSADVGVYQSFDAGATWTAFANSLPNALAYDLVYHPHARVLRVALRNRGVWEIPVDGWLTNPICAKQWDGVLNPFQTQTWFTFNWPSTWHMVWTVMPTTFAPGAPEITWKVKVERANAEYVTYWIEVKNLTNSMVNFEGRYAILSFY